LQTLLITGSDRGIGLEFVKQYAEEGWKVLATYLGPETPDALQQIAQMHPNVILYQLDVTDFVRVKKLSCELKREQIDLLINNAGIFCTDPFGKLNPQAFERIYRTNAIAPLIICESFHPLLTIKNSVIVSISSKTASIGGDFTENMIAYRMSKAALNMAMQEVARRLAPQGVVVLLLAPGYVRTSMSPQATLEPFESVSLMRQVIARNKELNSGGFYDRFGTSIEW